VKAKEKIKRSVLLASGLLLVIPMLAAGCTGEAPSETEVVSSCVGCHTDKDLLKQTATVVEEEKSEETTGEG
jgi:hypothetical protein